MDDIDGAGNSIADLFHLCFTAQPGMETPGERRDRHLHI